MVNRAQYNYLMQMYMNMEDIDLEPRLEMLKEYLKKLSKANPLAQNLYTSYQERLIEISQRVARWRGGKQQSPEQLNQFFKQIIRIEQELLKMHLTSYEKIGPTILQIYQFKKCRSKLVTEFQEKIGLKGNILFENPYIVCQFLKRIMKNDVITVSKAMTIGYTYQHIRQIPPTQKLNQSSPANFASTHFKKQIQSHQHIISIAEDLKELKRQISQKPSVLREDFSQQARKGPLRQEDEPVPKQPSVDNQLNQPKQKTESRNQLQLELKCSKIVKIKEEHLLLVRQFLYTFEQKLHNTIVDKYKVCSANLSFAAILDYFLATECPNEIKELIESKFYNYLILQMEGLIPKKYKYCKNQIQNIRRRI